MMWVQQFKGELAGLSAALIWAIASFVYMRLGRQLSPLMLNGIKSGLAVLLILLTLGIRGDALPQISGGAIALLLASGAVGIGIGDTAFFGSLNAIGARRALLLEALAPPLAALLALVCLGERLQPLAWLGITLTVIGVSWVVVEREPEGVPGRLRPLQGIGLGLIAALGQAAGAVMSRAALAGTDISPLWSTLLRLLAGVVVLLVWLARQPQLWKEVGVLRSPRFFTILLGTTFAGTYLAIWLQQTALKFTAAGIAQALTATSPLFVIPIAWLTGEQVTGRAVWGVLVALGGIWLLFGVR